ncbi:MAG: aldehyde dehydrogenase family protein [Burkholderiales bacterium]
MSQPASPDHLVRDKIYINGRWVPSQGSGTLTVVDSNTGQPMGTVPKGSAADVNAAVDAARAAFDGWSQTPLVERAAYVTKLAEGLQKRSAELATLMAREVGTPAHIAARMQVGMPLGHLASFLKATEEFHFTETIGNTRVVREPVGVVAAITPWNFPLNQVVVKVAPALLVGCTVVLKPSEVAPFNAFVLTDVIEEIGLPPGVFNLVCGEGPDVGEALVKHPEVDCVSFTGSTRAGKRIAELAAGAVKRVRLELGGKSASVVLPSADFAAAIPASVGSCYTNSGQTCAAYTRLLVPRARLAEAVALAKQTAEGFKVGNAFDKTSRLGPLISQVQLDRVRNLIARGIESGAELVTGGAEPPDGLGGGFFVKPTVFVVNDPTSVLAQEEVFGPVLSIIPYDEEADAVRIANNTPYGLSGAVWAGTDDEALRVASRIRTGGVQINGGAFNLAAPFGGYKQSGIGRENGRFGLEDFLETKSLHLRVAA